MSGLMHKVKDALSGDKNTPEAEAANKGSNGMIIPVDGALTGFFFIQATDRISRVW